MEKAQKGDIRRSKYSNRTVIYSTQTTLAGQSKVENFSVAVTNI